MLLGGAAAWPLAARAQQPALPLIGFLGAQTPELFASRLRAFGKGLSETGYVEGKNVAIEYRWAQGQDHRLPALAGELVRQRVAVIVTSSTSSAAAAKATTRTIPIVFSVSSDPVQLGFVQSLNRPGGNLTGSTNLGVEVGPKRLELLRELLPAAQVMAFLVHPANPDAESQINQHQAAARALGLELHILPASTEAAIDTAFASLPQLGVKALVISPDNFFNTRSDLLATMALRERMPAIFNNPAFAVAGGLLSYGTSIIDQYRLAGVYAGRILKGAAPPDLPVQQATKIEFYINLKTARVLNLTIPPTLLVRADEVIE
jgi:putative tryptophan/tyrosine transport system substrate-binding protein